MSNLNNTNTIVLCQDSSACPTLAFQEDGTILFRDDFGGQIQLTAEQLSLLFQKQEEVEHLIAAF